MVKNNRSDWVVGFFQCFMHAMNKHMEIMTLREGLRLVIQQNLTPIEINVDSKEVIHMLFKGNPLYDQPIDD